MSTVNAPPVQGSNVIPFPRAAPKSDYDLEVVVQTPELAVILAMVATSGKKRRKEMFDILTVMNTKSTPALRDAINLVTSAVLPRGVASAAAFIRGEI